MKKTIQFSFSAVLIASLFTTCKKDNSDSTSPLSGGQQGSSQAAMGRPSYIYTQTNEVGTNHILIYNQHTDGSLSSAGNVASGGAGAGSGLGSEGALALNQGHNWLFAVNAGDNTISSFAVMHDGSLSLTSTVASGGMRPISITVYGNFVYILNGGSENINGFTVDTAGMLSAIANSQQSLSGSGTSPEQIAFGPDGGIVYVTEKAANIIASFAIDSAGNSSAGVFTPSVGNNPYGFDFAHRRFTIVSNAEGGNAGASTVTSYNNAVQAVNGAVADNGGSACWLATDRNGFYAYVSNASSNSISSFWISPADGHLVLLISAAASTTHPLDIMVSGNNLFVYNLSNQTIGEYSRGTNGSLTSIGTVTGLPASVCGLVGY